MGDVVIATFYRTPEGKEEIEVFSGYDDTVEGRTQATLDILEMRKTHRKLLNGPPPVMKVVKMRRELPIC